MWPHVVENPLLYECTEAIQDGFPKVIQSSNVSIFHYARGWKDTAQTAQLIQSIETSAADSIAVYDRFATVPDLTFIIVQLLDKDIQAETRIPQQGLSCQILIFPIMLSYAPANQTQILAHEIYHCVQLEIFKIAVPESDSEGGRFPPYDWWIDGSAEYMSNVVYPKTQEEWEWEEVYDPRVPIYRQGYAASIFFQWME